MEKRPEKRKTRKNDEEEEAEVQVEAWASAGAQFSSVGVVQRTVGDRMTEDFEQNLLLSKCFSRGP